MKTMLPDRQVRPKNHSPLVSTLASCWSALALSVVVAGTAWGQQIRVTGTVLTPGGGPLRGASVRVAGADSAVITNDVGRYSISAPATGTLTISFVGYQRFLTPIGGRTTINVTMSRLALLEQVVVTSGYGGDAQQRSQITGAVATVNVAATERQTTASVLQKLDATVSGITVQDNGSPGSRSTVRIRGISSFQNNDPLYVIDGTPVQDTYVNFINPEDITSIQVLKDASAASIYGSRASNGVIIIETRKGGSQGPPRTTLSVRTGTQSPTRGYDDFLLTNSLDYFQVRKTSLLNSGLSAADVQKQLGPIWGDINNPSVPMFTYTAPGTVTATDAFGRATAVDASKYAYPNALIMPGSAGTDWWKAVFKSAPISDVNLGISGAGTGTQYAVSFNYFDQNGTAAYNRYRRGTVRANTQFTRNALTVGENLSVVGEGNTGGLSGDYYGEGGFLGKNILSQPVVSIYDVSGGNFASGKAPGYGNNTNPLAAAYGARNNTTTTSRFFGNVFGNYDITKSLAIRTTFGGNVGETAYNQYSPITPENSEPNTVNGFLENNNRFTDWTWSNTLRYSHVSNRNNLSVLVGQEINKSQGRFLQGGINGLINNDISSQYLQPALGTIGVPFSSGYRTALLSYFGKIDYTFNDRYVATATVRRDGSSNLGPGNQYGTFPAAGLAWKVSREAFLQNNSTISDLQLRVGYGVTGNQQIPGGRTVSQYGGDPSTTYYNITGGSSAVSTGYRLTSIGNSTLKWESNRSVNAGFDLGLFNSSVTIIGDYFNRTTSNLLFDPAQPATAGQAAAPFLNIGTMRNAGYDFTIGHQGRSWSLNFNGSHYSNKILKIDGETNQFFGPSNGVRTGSVTINQIGQPIGSFYGLVANGYFRDSADVASSPKQDGAAPGRIKFKDVNGDGVITQADRTTIGSPHPKFTGGLDGTVRRGRFDLGATIFGTFGNKIFDAQKYYYVFQTFQTNVRSDLLANSWTPTNLNPKYPRLDASDSYSSQTSSFYVEDGSYVRLRNVQLGYTLPQTRVRFLPAGSRIYVQAENLFTITGYNGLDPSLSPANVLGSSGQDIRDQIRGVDQGVYPTSRTFSVGITTSF